MADGTLFGTLSVDEAKGNLLRLLQRVTCDKGRIEITASDGSCDCVLISKEELESLEKALEILFNDDGARSLCDQVARLAAVDEEQESRRAASA